MLADDVTQEIAIALAKHDGENWDAADFTQTLNGNSPDDMRESHLDAAKAIAPIIERLLAEQREKDAAKVDQFSAAIDGAASVRANASKAAAQIIAAAIRAETAND